jgi:hypothetical protein
MERPSRRRDCPRKNPCPIIIPCHRAIRSDHTLGGFQGGLQMKRAVLAHEGIQFSDDGKIISGRIYYRNARYRAAESSSDPLNRLPCRLSSSLHSLLID